MELLVQCANQPTLQFAAEELQRFLQPQLPQPGTFSLSLSLREAPQGSYGAEISAHGGQIWGDRPGSVLLAVYEYLRRLGFRFLHPGEEGTFPPEKLSPEDLAQQFSITQRFSHRGICIEGADALENVLDMLDWLPKAGFSSFFLQFKEPYFFLQRWYDHVKNDRLPPEERPASFYRDCYRRMEEAIQLRDLQLHSVGHGFTAEALGYPSIGWIPADTPPDAATEPLIALVDGKRELVDGIPLNTNLCYSNPAAVQRLCDAVLTYAAEHPGTDYLHVWLADDYNHICECPACRETSPTDQYISILNTIDKQLTEKNLPCKIVFLLYQELLYPPEKEKLHNPDRFLLMFAPISRSFRQSYPRESESRTIPPYRRNRMVLPHDIHENLSYLTAWQQHFSGDSFVYDYPLGKAHYGDFGYQQIAKTLFEDIHRLEDWHLNGYMSCQELRCSFPTGLPNFVMGRALADPNVSFPELCKCYYTTAYGEDFRWVQSYLTELSDRSPMDYFIGIGPRRDAEIARKYRNLEAFAQQNKPQLKRKLSDSKTDLSDAGKKRSRNWQRLLLHADYCILLSRACRLLAEGDPGAGEAYQQFCHFVQELEMELQPFLDVYRIQEVTGKYTGFTDCKIGE